MLLRGVDDTLGASLGIFINLFSAKVHTYTPESHGGHVYTPRQGERPVHGGSTR